MQLLGITSAYFLNDSNSLSKARTQLWECVPLTGISNNFPANTLEVLDVPPIYEALLAERDPSIPWALLNPNSNIGSSLELKFILEALVAISVLKLNILIIADSTSWHWYIGPLTFIMGSLEKITLPSSTASTSHENLNDFKNLRNSLSNKFLPSSDFNDCR